MCDAHDGVGAEICLPDTWCGCGCWCCRRIRPPDNYIIGEAGHEGRIGGRVQCEPTIWTNAPNRATSRQAACQATLLTNFWKFLQNIGKFLFASVQVWKSCGKFWTLRPSSWSCGKRFNLFARATWVFFPSHFQFHIFVCQTVIQDYCSIVHWPVFVFAFYWSPFWKRQERKRHLWGHSVNLCCR